jgi:hypothetical protein
VAIILVRVAEIGGRTFAKEVAERDAGDERCEVGRKYLVLALAAEDNDGRPGELATAEP